MEIFEIPVESSMGKAVLRTKTMIISLISAADHYERDLNF
jgi:hypothetical protein